MKLYIYTVEGSGNFPWDMLRYDACWPARMVDVNNLQWSTMRERRLVLLRSIRAPTIDRWKSYGWDVNIVSPLEAE